MAWGHFEREQGTKEYWGTGRALGAVMCVLQSGCFLRAHFLPCRFQSLHLISLVSANLLMQSIFRL